MCPRHEDDPLPSIELSEDDIGYELSEELELGDEDWDDSDIDEFDGFDDFDDWNSDYAHPFFESAF